MRHGFNHPPADIFDPAMEPSPLDRTDEEQPNVNETAAGATLKPQHWHPVPGLWRLLALLNLRL